MVPYVSLDTYAWAPRYGAYIILFFYFFYFLFFIFLEFIFICLRLPRRPPPLSCPLPLTSSCLQAWLKYTGGGNGGRHTSLKR